MTKTILQTALTIRQVAINALEAIPEDWYDLEPNGYNHNIKWNVGHIITIRHIFHSPIERFDYQLPDSYPTLFAPGTKPANWTQTPPSKEELLLQLKSQFDALGNINSEAFKQEFDPPLQEGPLQFKAMGEAFNFLNVHEGVHLGMISGLVKAITAK